MIPFKLSKFVKKKKKTQNRGQYLCPIKETELNQRPEKASQMSWTITKPTNCTVVQRPLMLQSKEELLTQILVL